MNHATAGRIGALNRWSRQDTVEGTAKARAASPGALDYWERKVDPDMTLPADVRAARATRARRAHFVKLAAKSAEARRKTG